MTLQELCEELNYSENTFKRSFKRTCDSLKRKGYIITKTGYGNNADYTYTYDKTLIQPKKSKKIEHTDLIGQRFGHLIVLKDSGERFHRGVVWECQCDCGRIKNIPGNRLKSNRVKSCGDKNCQYHNYYEDLQGKRFGKLVAIEPTTTKDGSHMYWLCQCDCGNICEVASSHLKRGSVQSCGCLKTSIGEMNIKRILEENHIEYQEQVSFPDLKNIKPLRYDFGIYKNGILIRLIEFDGIQHYQEQEYFTHSLTEIKNNDIIKNEYSKKNNIPLVRIPYWERDKITIEMILGEEYLI